MSPICSGPLSERKEIEVLEESLREQAAEIAELRRAVRLLCSNLVQTTLLDGTVVWDLGSMIRTPSELREMPADVLPTINRVLEEER